MIISMRNVSKKFKRYKKQERFIDNFIHRKYISTIAVNNFDLEIQKGEIIGLLGQNGAGKTTIMKLLTGLLEPSSGDIDVMGYKPFDKKNDFKKNIGLVLGQKQQLWWDIPAKDNFYLLKQIYDIDLATYNQTLDELVDLFEISKILNSPIRTLSLGERMKCELVASLIHSPKILFLDEPTIGLDLIAQEKTRNFILQYNKRHNATILVTSHYMEDIEALCERTIFIDKGKKYYDGKLDDFLNIYGNDCLLSIEFNNLKTNVDFSAYGEVIKMSEGRCKIKVSKEQKYEVKNSLTKLKEVNTITEEDMDASHIVREYFLKKEGVDE